MPAWWDCAGIIGVIQLSLHLAFSQVPSQALGAGEAATVPALGQCTNWWGRHAENQWRGSVGATGCSLSLLGAGRPRPEPVVE